MRKLIIRFRPVHASRNTARAFLIGAMLTSVMVLSFAPAQASEFDRDDSGNPVHLAGSLAYPAGYLIEYVLLRPAHWLGERTPFRQVFGQDTFNEAYN